MTGIERVVYRSGFVKLLREAAHLPAITFEAADLPEDVVALVDAHLLDLGGTYGVPEAGDPIQYDELRIEHDQGDVEIVVYNRAILLFTTDSEAVRWIHEVCCRLDDIAGSHGRGIPVRDVYLDGSARRWESSPRTGRSLPRASRLREKPPPKGGESR